MPSISVPAALAIGGAASAAGAIGSGIIQGQAATKAAGEQAQAATTASNNQLVMFNTTQANLKPFVQAGQTAIGELGTQLPTLTAPFQPTMAQLSQTPGYQFALQQGELGVQNSFAAQGLGTSGAAVKGAANYAEGLASTTYQQQFQNYLSQNQQIYNMYSNLGSVGENAAAQTGSLGQQATSTANSYLTSGAAASAAGTVGAANAASNALGSVGSTGQNLGLLYALNSGGLFGTSGAGGLDFGNVTDEQIMAS